MLDAGWGAPDATPVGATRVGVEGERSAARGTLWGVCRGCLPGCLPLDRAVRAWLLLLLLARGVVLPERGALERPVLAAGVCVGVCASCARLEVESDAPRGIACAGTPPARPRGGRCEAGVVVTAVWWEEGGVAAASGASSLSR